MNAPTVDEVWGWLAQVEDPEIPVISIVDLGIVREVRFEPAAPRGGDAGTDTCVVTITPTYSGCPATHVIADSVVQALRDRGLSQVRLEQRIAPPWTTDWMSQEGKRKLRDYGIAPPIGLAAEQVVRVQDIGRGGRPAPVGLACPLCGSTEVSLTSEFGSTPCKALYRCSSCLEPFDHFKCH